MSQALEFTNLDDALAVYSDLPWKRNGAGKVSIFDAKKDEYVRVAEGQFIVSIGERFEVHDEEPEKAKHVEPPTEAPAEEAKSAEKPRTQKAKENEKPRENKPEGIRGPVTKTSEEIE